MNITVTSTGVTRLDGAPLPAAPQSTLRSSELRAEEVGHEFHGNQWVDADGNTHDLTGLDEKNSNFVKANPYLYHVTDKKNTWAIAHEGIKPSTRGYSGRGTYLATTPEATQYYHELTDKDARLFRVPTEHVLKVAGIGAEGTQYDDLTREAIHPYKVKPDHLQYLSTVTKRWRNTLASQNPTKLKSSCSRPLLPLCASTASAAGDFVDYMEANGKLPPHLPAALKEKMRQSLARYFSSISQDKIRQFSDKAEAAVRATLRTLQEARPGVDRTVEVGGSNASGRTALTDFIEGTDGVGDIGATMNMGFYLRVAEEVAKGGMNFVAQNWDQERVDEWPALEFHRLYEREVPRGEEVVKGVVQTWNGWDDGDGRWVAACEEAGDDDAAEVFSSTGRCVALKSSGVWQALGDGAGGYTDTLGNQFEPFAFNSGWGTDEVDRKDAVELGLMDDVETDDGGNVKTGEDGQPVKVRAQGADVDFDTLYDMDDAVESRYCAYADTALRAEEAGHEFHGNQWTRNGTGIRLKRKGDKWVTESGAELPEHAKNIAIPPAWKNVQVAPDAQSTNLAVGQDEKGRSVKVQNPAFAQQQADEKFSRNSELLKKRGYIFAQNEANLQHEDPKVRENAACMKLVQQTGIRPGSDTDTLAEKQAYGATTLEGRHVVRGADGNVRLQFTGKKGVALDIPVEDKGTADMLLARKAAAGESGKLFNTDDAALRDYSHTLDGGSFKPKDFRTLKGTETAIEEIKQAQPPKTFKDYKRQVLAVAKRVAAKLGNTPTIALQSYINPFVFSDWKRSAGVA